MTSPDPAGFPAPRVASAAECAAADADAGAAAHEVKALMLRPPRLTLTVAESLTCGRLQAQIGAVSGASEYFLGGVTAYTLDQKVRHLGVNRATAEPVNSVSREVAVQMARGAAALFGADVALATTGYAEPAPERAIAHPQAWWALVDRSASTRIERAGFLESPGLSRTAMQAAVATAALRALVAYLREAKTL